MKKLILFSFILLLNGCNNNNMKVDEIKPIGAELKNRVIESEVLPHIKEQESLIILLNRELNKLKKKSKCGEFTDTCGVSQHDDPMQKMEENDACIALLDERRKYLLKNCIK
jgi:hypothetical protein